MQKAGLIGSAAGAKRQHNKSMFTLLKGQQRGVTESVCDWLKCFLLLKCLNSVQWVVWKVFFPLLLEKQFVLLIWYSCKCLAYLLEFTKKQSRLDFHMTTLQLVSIQNWFFPAMCVQKQQPQSARNCLKREILVSNLRLIWSLLTSELYLFIYLFIRTRNGAFS